MNGAAFQRHHLALAIAAVGDPAAIRQAGARELALFVVGVAGHSCQGGRQLAARIVQVCMTNDGFTGAQAAFVVGVLLTLGRVKQFDQVVAFVAPCCLNGGGGGCVCLSCPKASHWFISSTPMAMACLHLNF